MPKVLIARATLSELVGELQYTSKMPGPSWSIDAIHCITGQKLRAEVPTSPCAKCYAMKGNFCRGKVKDANRKRLHAWATVPNWAEAMASLIETSITFGDPFFRWFSSGDLQSVQMLRDIVQVCTLTPMIHHWLPTQERGFVTEFLALGGEFPVNLTLRVSASEIGGVTDPFLLSSVVSSRKLKRIWQQRIQRESTFRYFCPSSQQDGVCGTCRACWDQRIKTIVYLEH